jgi:hypothetical protein
MSAATSPESHAASPSAVRLFCLGVHRGDGFSNAGADHRLLVFLKTGGAKNDRPAEQGLQVCRYLGVTDQLGTGQPIGFAGMEAGRSSNRCRYRADIAGVDHANPSGTGRRAEAAGLGNCRRQQGVLASAVCLASIIAPLAFSSFYFVVQKQWPGAIWLAVVVYAIAAPLVVLGTRTARPQEPASA